MTYRSVMQNTDPYEGPAVIGIYHTLNDPSYFGGENAWQVSVNIDVNSALINTAGITSASIGILDVASFQSSYQVAEGVLSGITSTNRLNLTYDPSINPAWVSAEGGRVIDVDVSENMVIVGGIATEPIWNFKNYSNQNSRMATISVVGISTRVISGAGASNATYTPGNVSVGSSFMINGQFQYYETSPSLVYKEILWDQGIEPDFVDSKMSIITFRIVNDDAGNVYVLGLKDGEFYKAP